MKEKNKKNDNKTKNLKNLKKKNISQIGISQDSNSKENVSKKPIFYKAVLYSLLIAAILVLLGWFQFTNPYFYTFKWLKLFMYVIALLLPVIIVISLGFMGLQSSDFIFYVISYVMYSVICFVLLYNYYKCKNKEKYIVWVAFGIVIYIFLALFFMW